MLDFPSNALRELMVLLQEGDSALTEEQLKELLFTAYDALVEPAKIPGINPVLGAGLEVLSDWLGERAIDKMVSDMNDPEKRTAWLATQKGRIQGARDRRQKRVARRKGRRGNA